MNDAQVVAALLKFYKDQGIDLSYMLDDPIFEKLPTQSKIEGIRTHAKEIVEGTAPGYTSLDRKSILAKVLRFGAQGAIGGTLAGAAVGSASKGVPSHFPAVLGGVLGLTVGVADGVLSSKPAISARKSFRNQMIEVQRNPSLPNVLGALSMQRIHSAQTAHHQEAYQAIREHVGKTVSPEGMQGLIRQHIANVEAANS
ncbi:MAG TPA: hypothetical protein VFM18_08685 [Methanosarcina sp.]|nr:hypothetical protein [Methanosarcina sp.]